VPLEFLSVFEDARTREGTAIDKRGNVEGQLAQATAALKLKQAAQHSPEQQGKRSATRIALADANAEVQSLTTKLNTARERVKELQRLVEVGAAERFRQSAQHARDSHQGKAQKLIQLRTQLEGVGANGLGEQIGQMQARIEQLERRRNELANQAAALVLLYDMLVDERDQLVQQLRAPLTQRVDEYLRRLMPQSQLTVTDDLSPLTLVREEGHGEFGTLSFGTQEQLGVVVRLAYADLLKDAGKPTLLIFDDAVTHSDLQRLERVKRALLHAAGRHQVFVLSCHPENWNDVGVPLRAIDELKAA
jgi:wobble nucleotide-excising tRNase